MAYSPFVHCRLSSVENNLLQYIYFKEEYNSVIQENPNAAVFHTLHWCTLALTTIVASCTSFYKLIPNYFFVCIFLMKFIQLLIFYLRTFDFIIWFRGAVELYIPQFFLYLVIFSFMIYKFNWFYKLFSTHVTLLHSMTVYASSLLKVFYICSHNSVRTVIYIVHTVSFTLFMLKGLWGRSGLTDTDN